MAILQGYLSKTTFCFVLFLDNTMRDQSLKLWVGAGLFTQLSQGLEGPVVVPVILLQRACRGIAEGNG